MHNCGAWHIGVRRYQVVMVECNYRNLQGFHSSYLIVPAILRLFAASSKNCFPSANPSRICHLFSKVEVCASLLIYFVENASIINVVKFYLVSIKPGDIKGLLFPFKVVRAKVPSKLNPHLGFLIWLLGFNPLIFKLGII